MAYEFSVAERMAGPWRQYPSIGNNPAVEDQCGFPRQVRHGSMIAITRAEYDALVAAFGISDGP